MMIKEYLLMYITGEPFESKRNAIKWFHARARHRKRNALKEAEVPATAGTSAGVRKTEYYTGDEAEAAGRSLYEQVTAREAEC